jgi:hypothetical protein
MRNAVTPLAWVKVSLDMVHRLAFTLAAAVFVLLSLKTCEIAYHCYVVLAAQRSIRNIKFPISALTRRMGLHLTFRFWVLLPSFSLLLAVSTLPDWCSRVGAFLIVGAVWMELLQALLTRFFFGYADILFRRLSTTVVPRIESSQPVQQRDTQDLLLFLVGFVLSAITSYAGVYVAWNRIYPGSFSGHLGELIDGLYLSTVTFATVGYGDISPITPGARLLTVSEIFTSMGCLVLLVFAYSMTSQPSSRHRDKGEAEGTHPPLT